MVRLSAPILTSPQVPPFSGSIEVDITAEDLSSDDPRQSALFGKCHLIPSLCLCINAVIAINAEDLPWRSAEFGKYHPAVVHLI